MNNFLLFVLFLGLLGSGVLLWKNQDKPAPYYFSGLLFLLFSTVLLVTKLDYSLGGSVLNLGKATKELQKSRSELEEVSKTVTEVAVFLAEKEKAWGDFPDEYRVQLDEYLKKLDQYTEDGVAERVRRDFERAHQATENK